MAQKLLLITIDPRDNQDLTDRIPSGYSVEHVAISPTPGGGNQVTVAVVLQEMEGERRAPNHERYIPEPKGE